MLAGAMDTAVSLGLVWCAHSWGGSWAYTASLSMLMASAHSEGGLSACGTSGSCKFMLLWMCSCPRQLFAFQSRVATMK